MLSPASILALVAKGLSTAKTVWDNRDLALQAVDSVKKILDRGKDVTKAEIAVTEKGLDALLAEFNAPLPPEQA